MSRMKRLLTFVTALFLAACSDPAPDREEASHDRPAVSVRHSVVVLGGDTSRAFANGLKSAGVAGAQAARTADVAERAKMLNSAHFAVILVDATQGPMPVNREDILLARVFCRGHVVIGFSQSAMIEDPELLELEELEMRELFSTYDLSGDSASLWFDSEKAKTNHPKGFSILSEIVSLSDPIVDELPQAKSAEEVEVDLYVLSDQETFARGVAKPFVTGTYRVILGDRVVDAEIDAEVDVQPGESRNVTVRFPEPIAIPPGFRFAVGSPDHILAAGFRIPTE